jgi:hypothetical protein
MPVAAKRGRAKNALINKSKLERPPSSMRDIEKYPITKGDEAETRNFTVEEQIQEFILCKQSCEYFISQYCTTIHPEDGFVPCILYKFQREKVLPAFMNERFVITRKFRQGGFSTVGALTILWMLIFKTDLKILVISKGDREAVEFMTIIQHAYDYLPEFLRAELTKRNVHIMETITGCRVMCHTPKASVSFSCKLIVIDEAAHIEQDMHKVWGKIYPVVSAGGSCWVISTSNGMVGFGEWYYKTWTKAASGENFFFPLDVSYKEHPTYSDPDWERVTRANIEELEFRQQYLGEFIGVSNSIFKEGILKTLEELTIKPLRIMPCPLLPEGSPQRNLMIYEEPLPNEEYILCADPAYGLGTNDPTGLKNDNCDFAGIQVIAMSDMRQVAEYRNDAIKTNDLATVAMGMASYYNSAVVVCEAGPLGQAFLLHLRDVLQYDNIFSSNPSRMMGLIIDSKNRPIITTGAVYIIEKKLASIRSMRLVHELRTLVFNAQKKRIDHLKGYHDDLFSAIAYGYYVREAIISSMPFGAVSESKPIYEYSKSDMEDMANRISSYSSQVSDTNEPVLPSVGNELHYSNIDNEEDDTDNADSEINWSPLTFGN